METIKDIDEKGRKVAIDIVKANIFAVAIMIVAASYFTLCVMDKSFKKQMAYLGSVSGRDEDKIGKAGLTPVYADNTVYFEEAKLVLVCKKLYQSELQESGFLYQDTIDANYPQRDFHTMYVGKIEKVLVRDDEYLK